VPARAGDVKHSLADISLAQKHLGYSPKVSFEEGLKRTVEWYRQQSASTSPALAVQR
jgi:nucleoside-diphosphate-sugar epimerase